MSCWLSLFLLLTFAPVWAQFPTTSESRNNAATVRVEVDYANGDHAPGRLRVQLRQGIDNRLVAMDFTSSSGTAVFMELSPGEYSIRVTGDGIEPAESETFTVDGAKMFQTVMVTIKKAEQAEAGSNVRSSGSSVAAIDLNVPKKAAKEFERGGREMADQNWDKGVEHLGKAIALYPQYSSAYNDLAVCYERLGQKEKQREALQKAIGVNDRFVPALVNLAHLEMKDKHLAEAVTLLNKAATADPTNVVALGLLAQADFLQGRYDQAIVDAHKVHMLPHQHFAIAHYTAAAAFERENRIPEAISELQVFLQEDPQSPRADVARKALATMQGQSLSQK